MTHSTSILRRNSQILCTADVSLNYKTFTFKLKVKDIYGAFQTDIEVR